MPILLNNLKNVYCWKITESINELSNNFNLKKSLTLKIEQLNSINKKRQFLSTLNILNFLNIDINDLFYEDSGRPRINSLKSISISHKIDTVAVAISNKKNVGVDIELFSPKILKAEKFIMSDTFTFNNENDKLNYLMKCWGAKESIFKIQKTKKSIFDKNFFQEIYIEDNYGLAIVDDLRYQLNFSRLDNYQLVKAILDE